MSEKPEKAAELVHSSIVFQNQPTFTSGKRVKRDERTGTGKLGRSNVNGKMGMEKWGWANGDGNCTPRLFKLTFIHIYLSYIKREETL